MRRRAPQRKRRKRNYAFGARSLGEKVQDSGERGGPLAVDPSANRTAAGIYGRRSSSSSRKRNFPATADSSHTAASRRSRFSRATARTTRQVPGATLTAAAHVVCAISENLARETCVASLDAGSPTVMQVTKQGNMQTYAETVSYLEMLQPDEIILNAGRQNSQLARKVLELYPQEFLPEYQDAEQEDENVENERYGSLQTSTVVKFVPRSLFDQTKGAELLKSVAREETYEPALLEEYILLASSYALLHYVQHTLGCSFAKNSVYLSINTGGNNRLSIDRSTMMQLELLVNSKTGKAKHSLVDTIDCTKTTVGSRLLRTNLMSPPMRSDTVNARLELVDLMLANEEFFYEVHDHLKAFPDVDKMLSNVALVPKIVEDRGSGTTSNEGVAKRGIAALICIKSTLQALPLFASVIQSELQKLKEDDTGSRVDETTTIATHRASILVGLGEGDPVSGNRQYLLEAILFAFTQPDLVKVMEAVSDKIVDTVSYSKNMYAMRHQVCFAWKCDDKELMAVLRKSFLGNIDDIYRKADEYAEVHGISVKVKYTTTRGYFLSIPIESAQEIPASFFQRAKCGRNINCTTEEIASLSARAQDNYHDLVLMTHDRVQEVMGVARDHYDALATVCDSIALLDMCHSFADHVTQSRFAWCRPTVIDPIAEDEEESQQPSTSVQDDAARKIMIKSGRFPIDVPGSGDDGNGPMSLVPNDTYATSDKAFTVVTGINGSGKSTYLKQIAIITILAHCGCYVPAEEATIPLLDRLCCRIGNADDQEHNISTFLLEMKETAFICNNATNRSLVLVDELGRATSNEDGVAIAWSLAEYLLKKHAMTFFVTHYPQLSCLAAIYPGVQNIHLESAVTRGIEGKISYSHKVKPGACSVANDYGVELAGFCGWPKNVVDDARALQDQVAEQLPDDNLCQTRDLEHLPDSRRTVAYKKLVSVMGELRGLVNIDRSHTYSPIKSEVSQMQTRFTESCDDDIVDAMDQLIFRTHPIQDHEPTNENAAPFMAKSPGNNVTGNGTPSDSSSGSSGDGTSDLSSSEDESEGTPSLSA